MRDRFAKSNLASLQEHEQLELLLFYAIPRCNTNETAHRLLNIFGSIPAIIDAPSDLLEQVPGMGKGSSVFFRFLREFYPTYASEHIKPKRTVKRVIDAAEIFAGIYLYAEAESLTMILLNHYKRVIFSGVVYVDGPESAQADLRKITHMALGYNAEYIILGHNHPSGIRQPSQADLQSNAFIEKNLSGLGLQLLDHIILGNNDYYSFAERGHILKQTTAWNNAGTVILRSEYQF